MQRSCHVPPAGPAGQLGADRNISDSAAYHPWMRLLQRFPEIPVLLALLPLVLLANTLSN
jgi:hypothetical protein